MNDQRQRLLEGLREHVDAVSEQTLFNVDADPPLRFPKYSDAKPMTLDSLRSAFEEYKERAKLPYQPPVTYLTPKQYAEWQAAGYIPKPPLDTEARIERRRNQRKLKLAQRYLRRAKTPGAKAAAEMSVRMLREMLK